MRIAVSLFLIIISNNVVFSQANLQQSSPQPINDSSFNVVASNNGFHIYEGMKYHFFVPSSNEHPYLYKNWVTGTVTYDHVDYPNISILYDLQNDALILFHFNGEPIQLVKERVNNFVLDGHKFVNLVSTELPTGFYEELYNGKSRLIVKREKKLNEILHGKEIEREFELINQPYLFTGNSYKKISNKHDLIKALGNEPLLRAYIKANNLKINFRKNWELNAVKLVSFSDGI